MNRPSITNPLLFPGAKLSHRGLEQNPFRWSFPEEINFMGCSLLGYGIGSTLKDGQKIYVTRDASATSGSVKSAIVLGLHQAGSEIVDLDEGFAVMAPHVTRLHITSDDNGIIAVNFQNSKGESSKIEPEFLQDVIFQRPAIHRPNGQYRQTRSATRF